MLREPPAGHASPGAALRRGDRTLAVMSTQTTAEPPAPLTSGIHVLGSTRARVILAATVFITTSVQAMTNPVVALLDGVEWPFALSVPVVLGLIILGCAVQAAALAMTERLPRVSVLVVTAVYLALALGLNIPTWLVGMHLAMALSLFLLATQRPARSVVIWLVVTMAVSIAAFLVWMTAIGTPLHVGIPWVISESVSFVAPSIAASLLGIWWATRARRMRAARDAAELARREHDERVLVAQESERARIAQELHDVAGQHLAGLITLADAALKLAPEQPVRALELLGDVRDEGRFASASLAGALADLRATSPHSAESVSDLRDIDELVEFWRARGMEIEYRTDGDVSDLPAVISATSYRCIKEALTNAAKHAPGASVKVTVAVASERVDVTVQNGPATASEPLPGLGLGWGLRGIAERLDLLQGTLATREHPAGGWHLSFSIPTLATL